MPDIQPIRRDTNRFTPAVCQKCGARRTRVLAKNGIEEWLFHRAGCIVLAPKAP
jgi:hypothetical protein